MTLGHLRTDRDLRFEGWMRQRKDSSVCLRFFYPFYISFESSDLLRTEICCSFITGDSNRIAIAIMAMIQHRIKSPIFVNLVGRLALLALPAFHQ